MTNKLITLGLVATAFCSGIGAQYFVNKQNYKTQYNRGIKVGFSYCIDTVNTILQNQGESDTTLTKLTLVSKDTLTYYLSLKIVETKEDYKVDSLTSRTKLLSDSVYYFDKLSWDLIERCNSIDNARQGIPVMKKSVEARIKADKYELELSLTKKD